MNTDIETAMNDLTMGKDLAWAKHLASLSQQQREEIHHNIQSNVLDKIFHYFNRNDLSFEDMAKILAAKAHRHMNRQDQVLAYAIDYALEHKDEIEKEILKLRPFLP